MPSKQIKGHVSTHDLEYKPGRRINWSNDLKIGKEGEGIVKEFLKCIDKKSFEVKYDQYRNRQDGR